MPTAVIYSKKHNLLPENTEKFYDSCHDYLINYPRFDSIKQESKFYSRTPFHFCRVQAIFLEHPKFGNPELNVRMAKHAETGIIIIGSHWNC